jgi:hypothetical protein
MSVLRKLGLASRMLLCAAVPALAGPAVPVSQAEPGEVSPRASRAQKISNAISELDVEAARRMLEAGDADSLTLTFERARLAIYTGDCDGASAILSAPTFATAPEAATLVELSKTCARATAGSLIVENPEQGLWLRLQDEADRPLVPFISEVAVRARASMARDLGVILPRPLRIDLVRDLFSLSAVSGLPLSAAETTGTVAVARWGRVTMLSPRATQSGYQWQDTLAHEITHLALSRATRDRAPLWLQEGVAKREETRWRDSRPFDNSPPPDAVAQAALVSGRAVGVDKLGASIALLPTADAASTAFAEVTSFMGYFIDRNGPPALKLLLQDLKGTSSDNPNEALRSVTGYELPHWIAFWQRYLREEYGKAVAGSVPTAPPPKPPPTHPAAGAEIARRVRLGDLLLAHGYAEAAAKELKPAVALMPTEAAVRWRAAKAALVAEGTERAKVLLGSEREINSVHGAWFALHGRFLREGGEKAAALQAFDVGIAADPWFEDVACEGYWRGVPTSAPVSTSAHLEPEDPKRRALCIAARAIPRD